MFSLRKTRVSTVFTSQAEDQDEKDNHFRSQRCVFALSTQVFFPIGGKGKGKGKGKPMSMALSLGGDQ